MLTEERINANYLTFIKCLEKYNCYSEEMFNEIGDKIKNAPYTMTDSYGGSYRGGLVDVTLNVLCKIGFFINGRVFGKDGGESYQFPSMAVNPEKLMKVLLLSNISKAVMFEDETEQWKINRGTTYRFVDNQTTMKTGVRSVFMCQKYNIKLDEDEYEAMMSNEDDTETNDSNKTPLYAIVKSAKLFTNISLKRTWKSNNKKQNTVEK